MLTLLTMFNEPLNLYQIKYLIKEYANDFELLGILKDINGLISIERTMDRHKLFSLSHHFVRQQAMEILGDPIEKLKATHREWINSMSLKSIIDMLTALFPKSKSYSNDEIEEIIDSVIGLITLFANVEMYFTPKEIQKDCSLFLKMGAFSKALKSINKYIKNFPMVQLLESKIYSIIDFYISNHGVLSAEEFSQYKEVHLDYCWFLRETNIPKNLKRSNELFQRLVNELEERELTDEFYSDVLNSWGLTFRRLRRSKEAISCFEKSLKFYETAENPDLRQQTKKIANIGIDRRDLFFSYFRNEAPKGTGPDESNLLEAVSYSEKALKIKNSIRKLFKDENNLDSLAFTYHSKGLTRYYLAVYRLLTSARLPQKECYYKDVFTLIEHPSISSLDGALKAQFEESLSDYEASIELFIETEADRPTMRKNIKAYCLSHFGDSLWVLGEKDRAIETYEAACTIYREFIDRQDTSIYRMYVYTLINSIKLQQLEINGSVATKEGLGAELEHLLETICRYYRELKIRDSYYQVILTWFSESKLFALTFG